MPALKKQKQKLHIKEPEMSQQFVLRAIRIQQGIEDWIGLDFNLTEEDVRRLAWAFAMDEDLEVKFHTLVRDVRRNLFQERLDAVGDSMP